VSGSDATSGRIWLNLTFNSKNIVAYLRANGEQNDGEKREHLRHAFRFTRHRNGFRSFEHVGYRSTGAAAAAAATAAAFAEALIACAATRRARARAT